MKNITVAVPDEVYRHARIRAAERGSSVSALVAAHLDRLSADDAEFEQLAESQREVQSGIDAFSGRERLPRSALPDRLR